LNLFQNQSKKPTQSSSIYVKKGNLGTFGGVFTPSILTILGVIMYLRFGWVVGNVGLLGSLIIVTLATGITFLTSLSIASIATDQKVKTGGAYYMISRSLGIELGGAIGIPLYIAQALSVSLYTLGFAESVVGVFPQMQLTWVAIAVTIFVGLVALTSAQTAIKAQYVIMFAIGLSLLSLIFGSSIEQTSIEMWGASSKNSEPFWTVFAVFFPAVTGIMAGVNMSGDLKTPKISIPKGTFYAVGTGYVIYVGLIILLASRADAISLVEDPLIMRKIAYWGDSILLGIWGATLSSAVGSILGAPRVLQALARDKILPDWLKILGKGSGKEDNPRVGTLFTLALALIAVCLGDLNMIAPILSMFFLTTYGILNLSAGVERLIKSPSFRPTFRVHWSFSLLGAAGCISVMFLINIVATLIAILIVLTIYLWLERGELKSVWGDMRRGIWMAVVREALMHIGSDYEPKTWRPNPIVLSGSPRKRWHLIDFASSITHNRGLLTVATVITDKNMGPERMAKMEDHIQTFLKRRSLKTLVKVIAADDAFAGAESLVSAYGLGKLQPNTVILGDSENSSTREEYCRMIRNFFKMNRNIILLRSQNNDRSIFGARNHIDLWWGGFKGNGGLMMILAHMLQASMPWRNATVKLKIMVDNLAAKKKVERNLRHIIDEIRISAEVDIILSNGRTFPEVLKNSSSEADLVIMGLAKPDDDFVSYYKKIHDMTKSMPTTLFVLAGQDISFGDVLVPKDTMKG